MSKKSKLVDLLKTTPLTKIPLKIKRSISAKKKVDAKRNQNFALIKETENKYGVDFGGYIPDINHSHKDSSQCNGYEASYPMPDIFRLLNIKEGDRILDVGSGKGYAMYMFSQFEFSKIDGVEISEELASISRENLRKIFPDNMDRYTVFCQNALSFENLDDYNYIYMYNPFPRDVVEQFVEKLKDSARRCNRKLIVIYQNPQRGALMEQGGVFKTVLRVNGTAVFESVNE